MSARDAGNQALRPRRLLMIAYHFPPLRGSSGIQRTLRFVQHLPKFGWEPLVLTASPRAYEETSDDQMREIPEGTVVRRAFALNTARHLSLFGRYPGALALPDRWATWRFDAVRTGMAMIRHYKPDAIWSTYPIATAHVIGATLAKKSGLPWIADFRDPMAQDGYPSDPRAWRAYREIEEHALRQARLAVFTTPGCAELYRERYPDIPGEKSVVIENGYDEETFARAEADQRASSAPASAMSERFVLLHSGVVYPDERDPRPLFEALGRLKRDNVLSSSNFCLRLRASAYDPMLADLAATHGIVDLVSLEPAIPYHAALQEMLAVDGLLILQASNCNQQIPAKLYEYVRAKRPVLALTDSIGDTAATLRSAGLTSIARLDDAATIAVAVAAFIERVRAGRETIATPDAIAASSREGRARTFAGLLDRTIATSSSLG
jgi:glycosyltransferase involved in cell wall biosynthesis